MLTLLLVSAFACGEQPTALQNPGLSLTLPQSYVAIGDSVPAALVAGDTRNAGAAPATVRWTTSDTSIAQVSSSGMVKGVAPGVATVSAAVGTQLASASVTVVAAGTSSTDYRVALTITRLVGGTGKVLVSSGIPLPPGVMHDADSSLVNVLVGKELQRLHVEVLHSRHPDGSVRSVLVQFYTNVDSGKPVAGELRIGTRRKGDIVAPTNGRSLPAAVALPSDPAYLVSTGLVGPTITRDQAALLGPTFARYDQDFAKFGDYHWQLEGDDHCDNYYDRALAFYAQWARTGNTEYWRRGTKCAWNYRVNFLEPNNYGVQPHWSQLEGLEKHYLLTGDDSSRTAVGRQTRFLRHYYFYLDSMDIPYAPEDRIRARAVMGMLLSWRLDAEAADVFKYQLDTALTKILSTQHDDGSYTSASLCNMNINYMMGQLNDALIKYYWWFKPDPRIPVAIKRNVDFLWNTQWVASAQLFQYMTGDCPNHGDTTPSGDLNNLIVNGFAFTYDRTGDATYRTRADQIFASAVEHTWLTGTKQFTQQYTSSFLYLGLRK